MRLSAKMVSTAVAMMALVVVIAGLGIYNSQRIGNELRKMAQEDIPVMSSITKITSSQSEQSFWLERIVVASETGNQEKFEIAAFEFSHLAEVVSEEIARLLELVGQSVESVDNEEEKQRYQGLYDWLSEIKINYQDYMHAADRLIAHLADGNLSEAKALRAEVEDRVESMNAELKVLNTDISMSTGNRALAAGEQEEAIAKTMLYISLIAAVLALGLGLLIAHSINRQLGGDPSDLEIIAKKLADGDLHIEVKKDAKGVYGAIMSTVERLVEIISGIKTGAKEVSSASEQVSQGNANLSQRTQEQASSLEQVASSMEQMIGTVNQNAENAQQAKELAMAARAQADKGGAIVDSTVTAMKGISESSSRIADIIGVIDEIAFQTNLLALNAAVEAARAGDQGRGFAVVASEVRNLAGRSAKAAKQIKGLIKDSVGRVEHGTEQVGQSGEALKEIVESVKRVSDIVAEIAAASKEQSDGIGQVNKALLQMDEMTQQNASLVEEAAAASEAMGAQAQELSALVSYFKVDETKAIDAEEVKRLQADIKKPEDKKTDSKSEKPDSEHTSAERDEENDDGEWKDF